MSERHLDSALAAAGISKLPETKKEGSFKGFAVIKMQKVGGAICWGLGSWNEDLKKIAVARDFDNKMIESVIEAYPYQKLREVESPEQMEARLTAEFEAKLKLKDLGIDEPSGTLAEMQTLILELQAEQGNVELEGMKEFLSGIGYSEAYLKRVTLDEAKSCVKKMKGIQEEVKELGGEPESDKKKLEAQLKELRKKKREEEESDE